MAGLDQTVQIVVALRIGFVVMPRGDVQRADAGLPPAFGEVVQIDAGAIRRNRRTPTGARIGRAARTRDRRAPESDKETVRDHRLPGETASHSTPPRPPCEARPSAERGPTARATKTRRLAGRRREARRPASPTRSRVSARADLRRRAPPLVSRTERTEFAGQRANRLRARETRRGSTRSIHCAALKR